MIASTWFTAMGLWGVAGLSLAGAAIPKAVLRGWDGAAAPRRTPIIPAVAAAGILIARGGYGLIFSPLRLVGAVSAPEDVDADWFWLDALLLAPAFVNVGASLAMIARDQWQRLRLERSDGD